MSNKTILITGCSSGIGRATAKYFQEKGWNVVATRRRNPEADMELNSLDNMLVAELDVTKGDTIRAAVAAGIERFGKIDVLLNNAGYGSFGVLEATPEPKIRRQYDTNVIGLLMVTKAILPHFRANRDGIIINVSSVGGKVTFPIGGSIYHGTKFAVEGISEALSYELAEIGVRVKIIEPGGINTNFATTSIDMNVDESLTEYKPFLDKVMASASNRSTERAEPVMVAEIIYQAATDGSDKMRYIAGEDAKQIIAARKQLDDAQYLAMIKEQYGM